MIPTVSICIPTYKQIDCLMKCLLSIIEQDYKNYELIISDDTPDDSVKQVIETVLEKDTYSYYQHTPSLGSPDNWNYALSKAKGKYIKIMHHDDYFTQKNSLSTFVASIEKGNADFVFSSSLVYNATSNTSRIHTPNKQQLNRLKNDPSFLFFKNVIGAPSATLYKNNSFLFATDLKWLVDVDFYIRYLSFNKGFVFINEPLICTVNETDGQVTQQVINDRNIQIKEHLFVYYRLYSLGQKGKKYRLFFEYLFRKYNVLSLSELEKITTIQEELRPFYINVFKHIHKFVDLKNFVWRLYNSRYNNYLFQLEQF